MGEPTGLDTSSGERTLAVGARADALDPALVGRWSRLVLIDATVGLSASETRWTFQTDGRVERVLVSSNLTLGLADQVVSIGTWRTPGGGTVEIVLDEASGATLRLAYAIVARQDGAELTLDGLAYRRLPS